MLTRRKLLQMKAALVAMPVASKVMAGAAHRESPLLTGSVFFDDRISDSSLFAQYAGQSGASANTVGDEITAASYEALKASFERRSGIIAGLMPEPMAYLLEVMARDVGHYRAFRGDHFYAGGKLVGHRFELPQREVQESDVLPGVTDYWTGELVDVMRRFDSSAISLSASPSHSFGNPVPRHDFRLASWIMAPLA